MSKRKIISEKIGEAIGSTVRSTAKGVYKGITSKTDEDLEAESQKRAYGKRVFAKQKQITRLSMLILMGMFCVMSFYFAYKAEFKTSILIDLMYDNWIYYALLQIVSATVNLFSYQIAEEITQ